MTAFYRRAVQISGAISAIAMVAACGSFDNASGKVASLVTPYKVEVIQGNFVSKEQVAALSVGMARQQVREILGTPLIASVFHADRWDYVFTIRRQGVEPQMRKLSVMFKDDLLVGFEGDEMPSETDFVATLETRRKPGKVPVLQASEESLQKFSAGKTRSDTSAEPAASVDTPAAGNYPPLEAPQR